MTIFPQISFKSIIQRFVFRSLDEADLFGNEAQKQGICNNFESFSDGSMYVFGVSDEDALHQLINDQKSAKIDVPEAEPTATSSANSELLHAHPMIFFDAYVDSMRLFLFTKDHAVATYEKAKEAGLAKQHELHKLKDTWLLVLSPVCRDTALKIKELALEESSPKAIASATARSAIAIEPQPQSKPEPEEPTSETNSSEPDAIAVHTPSSDLIHRNPNIYWDYNQSLRMFLYSKIDAEQTAKRAKELGVEHHEIYELSGDYILILSPVETRELCDQIIVDWLEDEAEDMAEQEEQLADNNKTCLNKTAYIYEGSSTVHIGFKFKKTRDEWYKYFELVDPQCKLEKREVSFIEDCKRELLITCHDIGVTSYGDEFLDKIKRFDFNLSPEENREQQKIAESESIFLGQDGAVYRPNLQCFTMLADTEDQAEKIGETITRKEWLGTDFEIEESGKFFKLEVSGIIDEEKARECLAISQTIITEFE